MPGPFPGMDPYLESPRYFASFHNRFIVYMEEAIQPALPEPYYAKTEERIWIERPARSVLPDVGVVRAAQPQGPPRRGTVAVLGCRDGTRSARTRS